MELSGPAWVARFPTSTSVDDLVEPFRTRVRGFLAALASAGASVVVADTLRRPERAYLMHWAFAIARDGVDPRTVAPMAGVDIQWTHTAADGTPDTAASRAAAAQMVAGYDIVFQPALTSRHTQGLAIDMTVTWQDSLTITDGGGQVTTVVSLPRTGAGNGDLHTVGRSYGVIKLLTDPPHWSSDGH